MKKGVIRKYYTLTELGINIYNNTKNDFINSLYSMAKIIEGDFQRR